MDIMRPSFLSRLKQDARGVSALEFAFVAPVLFSFLMMTMDMGRMLYARAVIEGELQRAAREASMQAGQGGARQSALDESIRRQVRRVAGSAEFTFERKAYDSYKRVSQRKEDFVDGNNNGVCDGGESFEDVNGNNIWDTDVGATGQGAGESVVRYTVTVLYPRVFPLGKMVGWSNKVEIKASTLLRNQPYSDLAAPVVKSCS